jgi:hypothetical protein
MRTILVHLNVEMPDDVDGDAVTVAAEVMGALDVGTDAEQTPALYESTVVVSMVEEV